MTTTANHTRRGSTRTRPHADTFLLPAAAIVLILASWQLVSSEGWLTPTFVSSPASVASAAFHTLPTAAFWSDVLTSTQEFVYGYVLAAVVGIVAGLCIGYFTVLNEMFDPWINAVNSIPRLAYLPLLVLWFGLGLESKIAIVFIGACLSITINTINGVRTIDPSLYNVARSFGASWYWRMRSVVLPSTTPFMLVGLRLGIGRGIEGFIIGEFLTSQNGLGYLIFTAGQTFQIGVLLFGALFITVFALLGFYAVARLERRVMRWRPSVVDGK